MSSGDVSLGAPALSNRPRRWMTAWNGSGLARHEKPGKGLILPLKDTCLVKDLYQAGNPEGYGAQPPGSVQSPMGRVASP